MRSFTLFSALAALGAIAPPVAAVITLPTLHKSQVPQKPVVAGQVQQLGGDGVFGQMFTTNATVAADWNITLVSAAYSLEVFPTFNRVDRDKKLIVMNFQLKNVSVAARMFADGIPFALVDTDGNTYELKIPLLRGVEHIPLNMEFRPAQAVLDLSGAIIIPAKAKISKIILQSGRKGTTEKVLRYFIAGVATVERDGKIGNPKNVITPLPAKFADGKEPLGATPNPAGLAMKIGDVAPFVDVNIAMESFAFAKKIGDIEAEDGHKLLVCTVKMSNDALQDKVLVQREVFLTLTDGDGDDSEIPASGNIFKATSEERIDGQKSLEYGKDYRVRWVFSVPANKTFKKLKWQSAVYDSAIKSHPLIYDISDIK